MSQLQEQRMDETFTTYMQEKLLFSGLFLDLNCFIERY
jgi:hypothetical protein